MSQSLKILSSMATRSLLAELIGRFRQAHGVAADLEAVGGVDAARRVEAGDSADVVVLAGSAIDQLIASGRLDAGHRRDLVSSGVAVAIRAGAVRPDISSEAALRDAVLQAPTIGYSTGPSGVHLLKVFDRWGIAERIRERLVQAQPGIPVGSLVAQGKVAIGFQQTSELMNLPGIDVLGPLPESAQITTFFTAAVSASSDQRESAAALIRFMALSEQDELKRRHGMEPA